MGVSSRTSCWHLSWWWAVDSSIHFGSKIYYCHFLFQPDIMQNNTISCFTYLLTEDYWNCWGCAIFRSQAYPGNSFLFSDFCVDLNFRWNEFFGWLLPINGNLSFANPTVRRFFLIVDQVNPKLIHFVGQTSFLFLSPFLLQSSYSLRCIVNFLFSHFFFLLTILVRFTTRVIGMELVLTLITGKKKLGVKIFTIITL